MFKETKMIQEIILQSHSNLTTMASRSSMTETKAVATSSPSESKCTKENLYLYLTQATRNLLDIQQALEMKLFDENHLEVTLMALPKLEFDFAYNCFNNIVCRGVSFGTLSRDPLHLMRDLYYDRLKKAKAEKEVLDKQRTLSQMTVGDLEKLMTVYFQLKMGEKSTKSYSTLSDADL